jgi:hypothetical protein
MGWRSDLALANVLALSMKNRNKPRPSQAGSKATTGADSSGPNTRTKQLGGVGRKRRSQQATAKAGGPRRPARRRSSQAALVATCQRAHSAVPSKNPGVSCSASRRPTPRGVTALGPRPSSWVSHRSAPETGPRPCARATVVAGALELAFAKVAPPNSPSSSAVRQAIRGRKTRRKNDDTAGKQRESVNFRQRGVAPNS